MARTRTTNPTTLDAIRRRCMKLKWELVSALHVHPVQCASAWVTTTLRIRSLWSLAHVPQQPTLSRFTQHTDDNTSPPPHLRPNHHHHHHLPPTPPYPTHTSSTMSSIADALNRALPAPKYADDTTAPSRASTSRILGAKDLEGSQLILKVHPPIPHPPTTSPPLTYPRKPAPLRT